MIVNLKNITLKRIGKNYYFLFVWVGLVMNFQGISIEKDWTASNVSRDSEINMW